MDLPEIPEELLKERFPGGFTVRDEANAIVAYAFRNGPVEDLHAGEHSELTENPNLSRITQDEMRQLMRFACEKVELLLRMREKNPQGYASFVKLNNYIYCADWDR